MHPIFMTGIRTQVILFLLAISSFKNFISAQSDFNPFISYPNKFTARSVSQPEVQAGHRLEPIDSRSDRSSHRRNLFFPPPDRLSPTRRPILAVAGGIVSPPETSSTPSPARPSASRFHPSSPSKFSTGSRGDVVTKTTDTPEEYEDVYYYYDDYYETDNTTTSVTESSSTRATETSKKPLSALVSSNTKLKNPVGFSKFHSGHFPIRDISPTRSPQPHSEIPPLRFRFSQDNKERVTRPPAPAQTPSSSRKGLLADLISQLKSKIGETENPSSNFVDSNRQSKQFVRPREPESEDNLLKTRFSSTVSTESTFVTKPIVSSTKSLSANIHFSSVKPTEAPLPTTQDYIYDIIAVTDPQTTIESHLARGEGKRVLDENSAKENLSVVPLESESPLTTNSFSSLFENIHIAVDPSLLPPGYSVDEVVTEKVLEKPEVILKSKTKIPELPQSTVETIISTLPQDDVTAFLPPGYSSTAVFESTTEEALRPQEDKVITDEVVNATAKQVDPLSFFSPDFKSSVESKTEEPIPGVVVKDIDVSAFLPPGFKPKEDIKEEEETPIPVVPLSTIDVSKFLPPGFKLSTESTKEPKDEPIPGVVVKKVDVNKFLPQGFKPKEDDEKDTIPGTVVKNVDLSKFLPPGFKSGRPTATTEATTTTRKVGPSGIVFPRRPKRPEFLTTTTTTTGKPAISGPPPIKPKIQNLFNRVKALGTTSEYKVPVVTEKIKPAESADIKEATTESTTTTTAATTTTQSTTTTPPIPTTPGICGSKCRLAASLRLISGTEWHPELANRDTLKFQELANDIENELDAFFRSSSISLWYDYVEVDSFNRGSVIVSYILSLSHIEADVDTKDLKEKLNTDLERVAHSLGKFTVDPEGTDFIVIPEQQVYVPDDGQNFLIPEWLIAVIVIGLASFLFILIFGVVALVSRARVRKRANVPLTEEFLNNLNALQVNGIDNYAMNGMYDMDPVWNEKYQEKYQEKFQEKAMKPPSSHGKGYNPEYNVNIYDSWRTDYSGQQNTSSSANHSSRRTALDFEGRQFYKDDPYDF